MPWYAGPCVVDPVAVIDAGYGSVAAVVRALRWSGAVVTLAREPGDLAGVAGAILPGVGHFAAAAAMLHSGGWAEALVVHRQAGRPLLGICLGMHLLFDGSEEGPGRGLGFLPGRIQALPPMPRRLHLGWARPTWNRAVAALGGVGDRRFTFAHGYACPGDHPAACARLAVGEGTWAMAVADGPVMGVQFHPEKSLEDGARLLAAFAGACGQPLTSRTWDA